MCTSLGIGRDTQQQEYMERIARQQAQYAAQQAAEQAAAQQAAQQQAAAAAAAAAAAQQPAAPAAPGAPAFDASPYRSQVDSGFGMFTPDFYSQKFAEVYNPWKTGVEGQYGTAKDQLTAGIAKKGLSNSQQGRSLFQQLDALKDQSLTAGQSEAQKYQDTLSGGVNTAKNTLYGSIGAGADNASLGSRAQTEAQRIAGTAAPASTLGDVFGDFVRPFSNTKSPGGPVNPEQQAFATGGNLNLANVGGGPEASTRVVNNTTRRRA